MLFYVLFINNLESFFARMFCPPISWFNSLHRVYFHSLGLLLKLLQGFFFYHISLTFTLVVLYLLTTSNIRWEWLHSKGLALFLTPFCWKKCCWTCFTRNRSSNQNVPTLTTICLLKIIKMKTYFAKKTLLNVTLSYQWVSSRQLWFLFPLRLSKHAQMSDCSRPLLCLCFASGQTGQSGFC